MLVISMLKECGALVKEEQCVHSYPYDWRTKQPVVIRPSKQWFINTASLKDKAKVQLRHILYIIVRLVFVEFLFAERTVVLVHRE